MEKQSKRVKIKAVSGVHGLYYYKGKHGKIFFSKIEKGDKTYKKSHGWGISLTTAKERHCLFVSDVNSGKYDDRKKKMLFESFVKKYIDYQKEHKRSWERDVTSTNALLLFFKGKHLADIDPLTIERYRRNRRSGKILVKKKKVTKATVNRECACLSKMFSLAEDWGYVDSNPLKKVKRYAESLQDINPLKREEERMLIEGWSKIARAKHAVLIFQIALYSLMRQGEVRKLRKDSINWDEGTIYIHKTKSGNPKLIYMNATLTELLKEAIKEDNYFHSAESDFVFTNPQTGKPYTSIKTSFNKAKKKAGLDKFKFHHTRHTGCSRLTEAGVDEVTIMNQGNWKTRSMINRYAHPSPEHKKEAMKKLDLSRPDFVTNFSGKEKGEREKNISTCN